MGDFSVQGTELKKLVKLAKQRPLSFATSPGSDDDSFFFALHKKLPPDVVSRGVKKESGATKIAYGLCSVEDKIMVLTCERELPALAKKLKKWLRKQKLSLNVRILDASGNLLEDDIEELPDDPTLDDGPDDTLDEDSGDEGDDTQVDPRIEVLRKRIAGLLPSIRTLDDPQRTKLQAAAKAALEKLDLGDLPAAAKLLTAIEAQLKKTAGSGEAPEDRKKLAAELVQKLKTLRPACLEAPPPAGAKLVKACDMAAEKLRAQDFDGARAALAAIEAALGRQPEIDPLQQQWETLWSRLSPVVLKALNADVPDAQRLRAAMMAADEAAAGNDYKKAIAIATKLEAALKEAVKKKQQQGDSPSHQLVDFTKARLLWARAKTTLTDEMTRLGQEIVTACSGDDFAGIDKAVGDLHDYLTPIDTRLEEALDALIQEDDLVKRTPLRQECKAAINVYLSELNSGIFTIIDDGNGFVSGLKLRKSAVAALDAITRELDKEKEPAV